MCISLLKYAWFNVYCCSCGHIIKATHSLDLPSCFDLYKQEGPKGPGSLTWGKGQRSQWSHLQRTTNVVHQILIEDLQMMLYIKYESSGPCSFRQKFFLKIAFWKPNVWPTYATNQNHLNNFGRGPPRDNSCWVWSNYN